MIHFVFGLYNDKEKHNQKEITEESSSYESYIKEHDRLEQLRQDSETIWEKGHINYLLVVYRLHLLYFHF